MSIKIDRRSFIAACAAFGAFPATGFAQIAPRDYVHPRAEAAISALRGRRWQELARLVVAERPQSGLVLVNHVAAAAPIGTDFGSLSNEPMGATIAAAAEIDWAWRFRGRGVASTITPSGLAGFQANLLGAQRHIEEARHADANDGIAQAKRIVVAKGLSDKPEVVRSLPDFLIAARRPVGGLSLYADAISGKWLGSNDEALAFARQFFIVDVPASCGLIPDAHLTCWGANAMDAHADGRAPQSLNEYFSDPTTSAEILSANNRFHASTPDPDPFANWYANAWFAYVLLAMNERTLAAAHFAALGDYVGGPWIDVPNPRATIDGIRNALGVHAS